MVRPSVLNHYPVLVLLVFSTGCAMPNARGGPKSVAIVADPKSATSTNSAELRSPPASAVSPVAYEIAANVDSERQTPPDGLAPRPERVLPEPMQLASATHETSEPPAESLLVDSGSNDSADPFHGQAELSVEQLVAVVQARNPSLQAASAAWRAAAERYPQVVSFDDPMFTGMVGPQGIGMEDGGGWMVQASQAVPWAGKRALRGNAAAAEAEALRGDIGESWRCCSDVPPTKCPEQPPPQRFCQLRQIHST
jgi:hypothetical protein